MPTPYPNQAWTAVSQLEAPSMGVWFTNVLMRAEQLTAWLEKGRPSAFWLTGFFNPRPGIHRVAAWDT